MTGDWDRRRGGAGLRVTRDTRVLHARSRNSRASRLVRALLALSRTVHNKQMFVLSLSPSTESSHAAGVATRFRSETTLQSSVGISRKENRSAPSRARGARERGGPTATGFAPVCVESYAANASVAVYQCAVGPAARLVRDNIRSARVWRRLHLQAAQPMPRAVANGADSTNGQCDGCRRDCHRRHLSHHRPESALESAAI